jgi:hypothetical protein
LCSNVLPFFLIVNLEGSTTVKVIVLTQLQPEPVAVIVADPAVSPAVKVTRLCVPVLGEICPPPDIVHVAGLPVTVILTSSPTPTLVLARSRGECFIVCEAMVHGG